MAGTLNVGARINAGNLEWFDETSATKATLLTLKTGGIMNPVQSISVVATTAQINAGLTFLAAQTGITLTVVGFFLLCAGNAAGATDIRISDTAASPVDVVTVTAAAAATTAVLTSESVISGQTLGTFAAALTASKGIQIRKTGSTLTGTTAVTVRVLYTIG
jgi:hypothetical protein